MLDDYLKKLKRIDYDKYLATLFAPKAVKEQVTALLCFHMEIAQVPIEISEPMVGFIKLQWWNDAFQEIIDAKPARPHPILQALHHSGVDFQLLQLVIKQYERLVEKWQPQNVQELEEFVENTHCVIFRELSIITDTEYNESIAKAYSFSHMARRLKLKNNNPTLSEALLKKSADIVPDDSKNLFALLTKHYNKKMAKTQFYRETVPDFGLALKLMFSKVVISGS